MAAHYDTYDYPAYWESRDYEHQSELIAISAFLERIKNIGKIVEIGAGYGRLVKSYAFRAKRVVLVEPSAKLLKRARHDLVGDKYRFIQSTVENIGKKVKGKSANVAIMIRVLHHITDIEACFGSVYKILDDNGYFILEFANKQHFKAWFMELKRGNVTFPLDIFPKDIRSARNKKKGTIPFINYHPDIVLDELVKSGFTILEKRSVSNIRSDKLKKHLPLDLLLSVERLFQTLLGNLNFGPSIFVLAQKTPHT